MPSPAHGGAPQPPRKPLPRLESSFPPDDAGFAGDDLPGPEARSPPDRKPPPPMPNAHGAQPQRAGKKKPANARGAAAAAARARQGGGGAANPYAPGNGRRKKGNVGRVEPIKSLRLKRALTFEDQVQPPGAEQEDLTPANALRAANRLLRQKPADRPEFDARLVR